MDRRTTAERNRELYLVFKEAGPSGSSSDDYGLTGVRIRAVVLDEGHRRIVSPERFYREIWGSKICEKRTA